MAQGFDVIDAARVVQPDLDLDLVRDTSWTSRSDQSIRLHGSGLVVKVHNELDADAYAIALGPPDSPILLFRQSEQEFAVIDTAARRYCIVNLYCAARVDCDHWQFLLGDGDAQVLGEHGSQHVRLGLHTSGATRCDGGVEVGFDFRSDKKFVPVPDPDHDWVPYVWRLGG